jgi:hypothetical protein
MKICITEQNHRTGKTREICVIDHTDTCDALNAVALPDWTTGCPIDKGADGSGFIADPDDDQHIISADVMHDCFTDKCECDECKRSQSMTGEEMDYMESYDE